MRQTSVALNTMKLCSVLVLLGVQKFSDMGSESRCGHFGFIYFSTEAHVLESVEYTRLHKLVNSGTEKCVIQTQHVICQTKQNVREVCLGSARIDMNAGSPGRTPVSCPTHTEGDLRKKVVLEDRIDH